MCVNLKGAKYHLMTVTAGLPAPIPENMSRVFEHAMEFGMCLPEICTKEDAASLTQVKDPVHNPLGAQFGPLFMPLLNQPGLQVTNPDSKSKDYILPPRPGCWVAVALVAGKLRP